MRFTYFGGNNKFTSQDYFEYSDRTSHSSNPRKALEEFKAKHLKHIREHQDAIIVIDTILATDGPEQAVEEARKAVEEAHPTGLHHSCNCTHTVNIRIGRKLDEALPTSETPALTGETETTPPLTMWQRVKAMWLKSRVGEI